jgi:lipooligosaccharide transport system permease protein
MSSSSLGTVEALRRQSDYWWTVYRRTWRGSVVASFLNPLLYVLAMGVLLGGFIQGDPAKLEGATSYLAFIAPGLVAAQSLQTAVGETTYPVMGSLKWTKVYFGMHATPLRPADIMNANLVFVLLRLAVVCGVFMLVMAPFGVFTSVAGAIGAWLASVLVGITVGTVVYAWSAGTTMESSFALIQRLGLMPQFLFSGAFFPIGNLSPVMEWFARVTPLWHGVDLTRMLALGTLRPGLALVHVAYLLVVGAIGYWWGLRRLTGRLVS